jgi:hypothetical protein
VDEAFKTETIRVISSVGFARILPKNVRTLHFSS